MEYSTTLNKARKISENDSHAIQLILSCLFCGFHFSIARVVKICTSPRLTYVNLSRVVGIRNNKIYWNSIKNQSTKVKSRDFTDSTRTLFFLKCLHAYALKNVNFFTTRTCFQLIKLVLLDFDIRLRRSSSLLNAIEQDLFRWYDTIWLFIIESEFHSDIHKKFIDVK